MEEAKNIISKNKSFQIGHIVTGNRLRKNDNIKFVPSLSIYKPNSKIEYLAEKLMIIFGKALGFKY